MAGAESDEMKRAKINKVQMARRMNTCRAALDRLLDPGNASVTLQTLCRAARAIGRDLTECEREHRKPTDAMVNQRCLVQRHCGLVGPYWTHDVDGNACNCLNVKGWALNSAVECHLHTLTIDPPAIDSKAVR
jgi:hypothetical protein